MRLEINVVRVDSKAEVFLLPISQGMRVSELRKETQRRVRKLVGWQQCEVVNLRQGSSNGPLLDEDDVVQGLLGPGERLWALCSVSSLDTVDTASTVASRADNEASAPAEDVEMLPDDKGKVSVKYQTIERLASGKPPGEVKVDGGLCTLSLAKHIADIEGINYSAGEDDVEDSANVVPFGSCKGTGCVCATANGRFKTWGYDAALKIQPAAFVQQDHPQRWAADLCYADLCSICLNGLSESDSDIVVGNRECLHFFHGQCLLDSFQADGKHQCPLCRGEWHYLEDPEKKNSTGEAGEALLVVLQASGEASCVYTDIKPGITVNELKSEATKLTGSDCQNLMLRSHGITHDDEAAVVPVIPPIFTLCERGAHPWSMQVTCHGPDGKQPLKRKMRSNDSIWDLKRSLHCAWRILPSKLRVQDQTGVYQHDAVLLGDLRDGVQVEAEVKVSISAECYTLLDLWVPSHRLDIPSTTDRCEDVLLEGEVLYVTQRCSFAAPSHRSLGMLGPSMDRMTLFAADESWQVVNRHQTEEGLSCLLSCLYFLAAQPESTKKALLSAAWQLFPFPPLQLGLALLLEGRGRQITEADKAAVAHSLFEMLKAIAPKEHQENQLFEHARVLLAYLLESSDAELIAPTQEVQTLECCITHERLQEPAYFMDRPEMVVNRSAAEKVMSQLHAGLEMETNFRLNEDDKAYWRSCEVNDLQDARHLSRLVKIYSGLSDCLVLRVPPSNGETIALSARSFPTWTKLRMCCGKTAKSSCLHLIGALSLKTCHSPPKLTRTKEGHVVVFTGHGKSSAGNCVIFSPLGREQHMDLDQVAKALADLESDHRDDRELREGVIVCLDISDSMGLKSTFPADKPQAETSMWELGPPQEESEELLNALVRRFDHHPGIYYLRQCVIPGWEGRPKMILEQLCQLLRGSRISEEQLRMIAKHSEKFLAVLQPRDGQVPHEFCCPITQSLMLDAVCASDGFTYERRAIQEWLCRSEKSPMTRQNLTRTLVENHALRTQIRDFRDRRRIGSRREDCQAKPEGDVHVDCWLPRSSDQWRLRIKITERTTGLELKRNIFTQSEFCNNLRSAFQLRLFHGDHLLPDLVPLTSLGIVNGSPITVALVSSNFCLGKQVKVVINRSFECTVAASEMVIALKCRYWAYLSQRERLALPLGNMRLWGPMHDVGDGLRVGTILSDDCCVGDFCDDSDNDDDEGGGEYRLVLTSDRNNREHGPRDKSMTRLEVVKQLFNAFVDRSLAYDYPCAIGLVCFGGKVTERCKLTAAYESFRDCVQDVKEDGNTCLFDALHKAGSLLKEWQNRQMSRTRSLPAPKLRIVALSDGKDTCSDKGPVEVARFLRASNIVVDSVLIGTETDYRLHRISKASGGYVFKPESLKDAVRLNELEVFLSCHERPKLDKSKLNNWQALGPRGSPVDSCSEDRVPPRKQPQELQHAVHGLEDALRDAAPAPGAAVPRAQRQQRILQEMRQLHRSPHPAVDIFPSCCNVGFWQATMSGPDGTAYAGGVWKIYVQFPADYPVVPPELRFITPIKHCNINQHGRVCHSILGRNWTRDTSMQVVLQNVYGLLLEPDVEDPLDSTLALAFYDDNGLYETSIVEYVEKHAKAKTRADWFKLLSAPEEQPQSHST